MKQMEPAPPNNFEDIHSQTLHPGRFSRLLHLQPSPMKRKENDLPSKPPGNYVQNVNLQGFNRQVSWLNISTLPKICQKRLGLERHCITHLVAFCQVRIPARQFLALEVQMVRNVHANEPWFFRLTKKDLMYKTDSFIQYSILIFCIYCLCFQSFYRIDYLHPVVGPWFQGLWLVVQRSRTRKISWEFLLKKVQICQAHNKQTQQLQKKANEWVTVTTHQNTRCFFIE